MVQTKEDALRVIQLSDRCNGALRFCPVEELLLGGEGWQLRGVDSWVPLEDQFGVLGRHREAQGAAPGPRAPSVPFRRLGGNLGRQLVGRVEEAGLRMLRLMDLKSRAPSLASHPEPDLSHRPSTPAARRRHILLHPTVQTSPPHPSTVLLIQPTLVTSWVCPAHPRMVLDT